MLILKLHEGKYLIKLQLNKAAQICKQANVINVEIHILPEQPRENATSAKQVFAIRT